MNFNWWICLQGY